MDPNNRPDDEESLLRSVALQNSQSILLERQRVDRQLAEERERLRITLASIADAVISTDPEGRVVYLNGVAETLTGWHQADAAGRPLPEVFHIINEGTRLPVDNPALRALAEGRIVELANHTLLIARDGTERPIDDSAAPMRDDAGTIMGAVLVFRDVSEKKRAEAVQLQLAAIVQSTDDAILSKTLDGIIRSWNAGAERIFGYSEQEAVGQHTTLIIPPDRISEESTILERLRSGERIEHFETIRITKDGRHIDMSLTVSPLRDDEGHIIGASKIGRDITASKRAEAALRQSESLHRFLADLAVASQPLTDAGAVMALTARRLAEYLHCDRCAYAEVEDESVFVITGDYSRGVPSIVGRWPVAAFGAECERCMLANLPFIVNDVDSDIRDGSDLLAYQQTHIQSVICVPLHKAGRFAAAMAVHQKTARHWTPAEIALVQTVVARCWESLERVRVARDLKQAAGRLALAFAAANLGDWSWNAATDEVTLAPRSAEIFGIPAIPNLTWTRMQGLIHVDDRDRARLAVERSVATHELYDAEYRVMRPGGAEVWVSAKGRAQYDVSGVAVSMFGVVQDITEKKQLEGELIRRAAELVEADRKKDDFIALLAHELRNPLAPVRTGLQMMQLGAGDATAVAKAQAMMERQLAHMVRLIDDLLDVSRVTRNKLHLQKKPVLLSEIVSHAVESVGPALAAAGHSLEVSLPDGPVTLDADLTRLAQVLGNLLSNSVKYTPDGGRIWLTSRLHAGEVIVRVQDSGIGIPTKALPTIFDMFSQVDRSVERVTGGLGIGLALVKGLVQAHGGSVSVESPGVGAGSTFTIRLPVLSFSVEPAPEVTSNDLRAVRTGRKVLLCDDNNDAAESLAELLTMLGNEVYLARDGIEAVREAERIRPDLVLMDVGMPRLNGLDATRQIRAQAWGQSPSIIAVTGWGQAADKERSRDAGCNGHLVKPFTLEQLEKLLAELPLAPGEDS